MTLLVRDEADIVQANIRHHLDAGVDFIVATDNGSTDGTIEILEEFQRAGTLHLRHDGDDTFDQARLTTEMAAIAREHFGADWVLSNDADEFWCGPLRDTIAATEANLMFCRRANRVAAREDDWSFTAARHLAVFPKAEVESELLRPIQPKVLVRAADLVRLTQGCHNAEMAEARPAIAREILIRHFPIRGRDHFIRKATAGGAAYARNAKLDPRLGGHWRLWHAEILAGRADEAYAAVVLSRAAIDAALAEGTLIEDDRLLQGP
ncbi:MAG: glycosyltransferase family 2 protein [Rhodospirillaceae bacterium]|nr:glycosyltransferase family 2 protein [Rhodospirillaceae bacterium]